MTTLQDLITKAGLDELVRDLTKVGSIPKSEVRRRITDLVAQAVQAYAEATKLEKRQIPKEVPNISKETEEACQWFVDSGVNLAIAERSMLSNKFMGKE